MFVRRCVIADRCLTESILIEPKHFRGASVPKMTSHNKLVLEGSDIPSQTHSLVSSHDTRLPTSPTQVSNLSQKEEHHMQIHPLLDKSTLKVHLPNGTFNVVRFGDAADIKGIIQLLTNRLYASGECRYYQHLYAMRMVNTSTGDVHWLHQDTTMFQVNAHFFIYRNIAISPNIVLWNLGDFIILTCNLYFKVQEKSIQLQRQNTSQTENLGSGNALCSSSGEWKFELRVRYLPTDLTDLYDRDKVTFSCYYDQVRITLVFE